MYPYSTPEPLNPAWEVTPEHMSGVFGTRDPFYFRAENAEQAALKWATAVEADETTRLLVKNAESGDTFLLEVKPRTSHTVRIV